MWLAELCSTHIFRAASFLTHVTIQVIQLWLKLKCDFFIDNADPTHLGQGWDNYDSRLITFYLIWPKLVDGGGGRLNVAVGWFLCCNATGKCKISTFSLQKKSVTQLWLKQYPDDTTLTQMTISVIRLWPNSFESESNQIWLTTYESSTTLAVRDLSDIEGSSWVRMRDRDIFPGVWLEDWARSARNEQGKYFSSRTKRLEKLYIFQLDVVSPTNNTSSALKRLFFYLKTHECKNRNIPALYWQWQINF